MDAIHLASGSEVKPRRAWLAALLSLLVPGLGQLYAGRPKRALAIYLGNVGIIAGFMATGLLKVFAGLIAFVLAFLAFYLWSIWDAARIAHRGRDYVLQPFNRWYWYLAAWLIVSFLIAPQLLAHSPVRSFRIPSRSMEPAILIGDHVYADMRHYRSAKPARGDLAIFPPPENPALQVIKRVIGLAGEEIEIRDKAVFLNGQPLDDPWGHHDDPTTYPPATGVLRVRDNFGPLRIPPGTVFVLGDDRDNSYDSRFYGPVPAASLQGRLLYVYWARDKSRIGTSLK